MIAILGGGITALAAALALKKANVDFMLLEATDRLGGKIQSLELDGYQLELGPNTVLINNPETQEFLKELGLYDQRIEPEAEAIKKRYVLKNNQAEPIPFDLSSAWKSRIFTFGSLLSVLKEPFKKAGKFDGEESLADFSRRRFGEQIYSDLLTPFVSGIYAGDPEKMSVNYTLSILKEAEEKYGSVIKGMPKLMRAKKEARPNFEAPKQKIFSFEGGLARMVAQAEARIKDQLSLNSTIEKIEKNSDGSFQISFLKSGEGREIKAEQIISCLPAHALAKLIGDLAPELSKQLNQINYVPALVSHFAFDRSQWKFNRKAFGLLSRKEEKVPFLGVLFNSEFFPHQSKDNDLLLTVISGGYRQIELMKKPEEEVREVIVKSLNDLGLVAGKAKMHHMYRWQQGIPQYELGYGDIEAEIKAFLAKESNFKIGGNFFKGISVSDCIANGTILAQEIKL